MNPFARRLGQRFLACCWDADHTVLAEWRSGTAWAAMQRANWLLGNVPGAVGAAVPRTQYEVVW